MKRFLLLLCLLITLSGISFSQVVTGTQKDTHMVLSYPLVYVPNQDAQDKINTDIARFVLQMRSRYYDKKIYEVNMSYRTTYEDENIISICLRMGTNGYESAHPYHWWEGVVYNKKTGERIPLYNYVRLERAEQLKTLISNGFIPVYNEMETSRIDPSQMFGLQNVGISGNYILVGGGVVKLLFQPYELSAYVNGVNQGILSPKIIEHINHLHN